MSKGKGLDFWSYFHFSSAGEFWVIFDDPPRS